MTDSPQGVKATEMPRFKLHVQPDHSVIDHKYSIYDGDEIVLLANTLERHKDKPRELVDLLNSHDALVKALEEATEALRPFAAAMAIARDKYAARYGKNANIGYQNFDKMPGDWPMDRLKFTMAEFRRAQTAVAVLAALSTSGAE